MIDVRPFLLRLSIISILQFFLRLLRRAPCTALLTAHPPPTPSSSPRPPPPPWWLRHRPPPKLEEASNSHHHKPTDNFCKQETSSCNDQQCKNVMGTHRFARGTDPRLISPIKNSAADKFKASRKRPAQLVIPASYDFVDTVKRKDSAVKEFEVIKGRDFFLARKKGRREVMEDRHAAILDISGDPKQAFFVVIDGHGGDAAADYVAENLGKNIVNELEGSVGKASGNHIEAALRGAYLATDKQFLAQEDVNGGACAAGVLLKNGEVHAANVGDCKVVLSRKGKAIPLTNDHRLSREDERARIENSGGFLYCQNGIWRVNGSLAVSRAFGDIHLKDWIISEPEIVKLPLTSDCQFLIVASDGLWDKSKEYTTCKILYASCKRSIIKLWKMKKNGVGLRSIGF